MVLDIMIWYLKYILLALVMASLFIYLCQRQQIRQPALCLQMITAVLLTINMIIGLQNFKYAVEDREQMTGTRYGHTKTTINRMFINNPKLDRLYAEMYPCDDQTSHQASNLILQKIADIYTLEKLDIPSERSTQWINIFRKWMRSPTLRNHWSYLKDEYSPQVQQFIDHLITN